MAGDVREGLSLLYDDVIMKVFLLCGCGYWLVISCAVQELTLCCVFSFSEGEIHFNLMAVVGDRRKRFVKEIERLESRRDLAAKMVGLL